MPDAWVPASAWRAVGEGLKKAAPVAEKHGVTVEHTSVQDIPSDVGAGVSHQVAMPKNALAHEVWVNRGSLLWSLIEERLEGGDTCMVNSRHHQAVKTVAPGFVVTATAPDGVVEAIERSGDRFCLGVQWHPENFWRTGEFRALFEGFVKAAGERQRLE